MFNRVAHQEYVTSHNITSIMGKSRKKHQYALGVAVSLRNEVRKLAIGNFVVKKPPLLYQVNTTFSLLVNGKSLSNGIWGVTANIIVAIPLMRNGISS